MARETFKEAECVAFFQDDCGFKLETHELSAVLDFMQLLGVFKLHEDPLTQRYIEFSSTGDDLKVKLLDARKSVTQKAGTEAIARFVFNDKGNRATEVSTYQNQLAALDVVERYINLGTEWLDEAISRVAEHLVPAEHLMATDQIPASDRIINRTDNQQSYDQAVLQLEQIIIDVSGNNEFANSHPEERNAVVADLKAGNEILNADSFWLKSIWETLVKALNYLVNKFGDAAVGAAAAELLHHLLPLLGLG